MDALASSVIAWSAAARTRRGETESGDRYLVDVTSQQALIVVVDGLGHGEPAAAAARTAVDLVGRYRRESLPNIAKRCHGGLHETRGGVIGMGRFDAGDDTLTWLAVGNVAGFLLRADGGGEVLVGRSGLLGRKLPALSPAVTAVAPGDMLIVTTDGVHWRPDASPIAPDEPELVARRILTDFAADDDDALIVVARYLGSGRARRRAR